MEKLILNRLKGGEYIGFFFFFYFCFYNFYLYINFFKKIRIEVINFKFTSMSEKHLNEDYKIIIKLRIFSKFTIIKIILTEKKVKKIKFTARSKKLSKQG